MEMKLYPNVLDHMIKVETMLIYVKNNKIFSRANWPKTLKLDM